MIGDHLSLVIFYIFHVFLRKIALQIADRLIDLLQNFGVLLESLELVVRLTLLHCVLRGLFHNVAVRLRVKLCLELWLLQHIIFLNHFLKEQCTVELVLILDSV